MLDDDNEKEVEVIESENYLARYIIDKKETSSKIKFLNSSIFESAISDYDRLHEVNLKWFEEENRKFYLDAHKEKEKLSLLFSDLKKEIKKSIKCRLFEHFGKAYNFNKFIISWDEKLNSIIIASGLNKEEVSFLNKDAQCKKDTTKGLRKIYQYTGKFKFIGV